MLETSPASNSTGAAIEVEIQAKYARLQAILREMASVLVAYSGGVDSALLLKVAHDVLGERALGAIASSPAYAPEETSEALSVAEQMGVPLLTLRTNELEDERYVANDLNRCYFCKNELFMQLEPIAKAHNLRHIAYGINTDDQADFRPGQRAAREYHVRGPLQEAGLGKREIRALARFLGVPVWDKPAMACFSSRIAYGTKVDVATIQKVYKAEKFLHELGFHQLRVRHHDKVARIEVERSEMARLLDEEMSRRVTDGLRKIGYTYVTLDLLGFRSGSMNEGFFKKQRA